MKITSIIQVVMGVISVLLLIGWILNIVKTFDCDFESPYKCEAIRVIGIFVPPVGGITGWIDIDDGANNG